MLRDITLGQYYQQPEPSPIHRLDARTKIIGVFIYIIALFVAKDFLSFVIAGAVTLAAILISRVPFRFILRGAKAIIWIILFTFVLNLFMMEGRILWQFGFLTITAEGAAMAARTATRLFLLIFGTSLLTFCTKPSELTDGLESLLSPFSRIGMPAHEIALVMTIALRFIPVLTDEADKIMKAQQSRGADFESGNLIARAKSLLPVLVPLFVSSFRISSELALAMEARCYGGEKRTRLREHRFGRGDFLAGILLAAFLGAEIVLRVIALITQIENTRWTL